MLTHRQFDSFSTVFQKWQWSSTPQTPPCEILQFKIDCHGRSFSWRWQNYVRIPLTFALHLGKKWANDVPYCFRLQTDCCSTLDTVSPWMSNCWQVSCLCTYPRSTRASIRPW